MTDEEERLKKEKEEKLKKQKAEGTRTKREVEAEDCGKKEDVEGIGEEFRAAKRKRA